jgi:hypothetical protein
VKNCPYCAEAIQDAAIVCKHCGRELQGLNVGAVTVRAKSRGWLRVFALLAVVGLVSITGLLILAFVAPRVMPSLANQHVVGGECRLSGAATVTPHDAFVGGDVLRVTNHDSASWDDAQISIYGQITSGPDKGPAGVHRLHRDIAPGVTAMDLNDFQTADGSRWVGLFMRVEGVGITATLRGEHCEVELSVHKP